MSRTRKTINDPAWEELFEQLNILTHIHDVGRFEISAAQIKKVTGREPRLLTKFDHTINLPRIFRENKLAILPITRGKYVISRINAYHAFESCETSITRVTLPPYIQSLDPNAITSEAVALNCAIASGIVSDFLEDEDLVATVSGRMGSGDFGFTIQNAATGSPLNIGVSNSQIEIDAAYEGIRSLSLFEAKCDLSDDFLVRQLYYPYRTWKRNITKPVRPIFLVYSNGIYRLYEYAFTNLKEYNSLVLVKQKNYSVEDTSIELADIQAVLQNTPPVSEPNVSFPQADRFERVINLCELLSEQALSRSDVTEQYAFDVRQTNYYTSAALYLDLITKIKENGTTMYNA
jgi:hypothetical protein